jgi:hypothetical protein
MLAKKLTRREVALERELSAQCKGGTWHLPTAEPKQETRFIQLFRIDN